MTSDKIPSSTHLLVEGKDDFEFFSVLFNEIMAIEVTITDCKGVGNIPLTLKKLTSADDYDDISHIGIALDIDDGSFDDTIKKIKDIFKRMANIDIPPKSPFPCIDRATKKCLFGLPIPGNLARGKMLEDLITSTCIPEKVHQSACVHVSNAINYKIEGYIPKNKSKAELISSLAVLSDCESTLSYAIKNKKINLDDERLNPLKAQLLGWINLRHEA